MKTVRVYILGILSFYTSSVYAQNCSVNAGLEGKWCAGDKIVLDGAVAGTVGEGMSPIWSLVSGPGPVTFEDSTKAKTTAIATVGGEYTFRLSVVCGMGKASQDVKHIVSPGAQPDAGDDVTVNCFDGDFTLPLDGNQPPPGFTAYWTVPNGTVSNNIYTPSFPNLDNCPTGFSTMVLQYNMKDANGCIFSDSKAISFLEYIPPLTLGTSGGCGKKFALSATCTGAGQGQWEFISPAGGGGASFESPNSRVTGIVNPDTGQVYVAKFTITGSCHDQWDTISFQVPEDSEVPTQADFLNIYELSDQVTKKTSGNTITYSIQLCGIPDSLKIISNNGHLKEGETGTWSYSKTFCSQWFGEFQLEPNVLYPDDSSALMTNLKYGSYSVYYTVSNRFGCTTNTILNISINQPYEDKIFFLSNECKNEDFSKNEYFHYRYFIDNYKIYDTSYIHFKIEPEDYPHLGQISPFMLPLNSNVFSVWPTSAPAGADITAKFYSVFNLTNHKFEYYLNIPVSAPSGQYIFTIPYIYSCGNNGTIVVDYSSPPEKVNGGTDQYFCGSSGQLIGNDRAAPEWILLYKKPADIPDPILEGANTRLLTITNLTAQSEYYFGYVSRGGSHCPDVIDTVKIGVSDVPPPKPDAGEDRTVCAYSAVTLTCQPSEIPLGSYGYWEVVSQVPAGMPPSFKPSDK
ncbi:MAG: hypothetical protein IT216_09655, partial [Saprospiraceae bacterium]|nr:hypothetical protein [Saprospiraceae bacterium]